jgi:hypothetical protein
MHFGHTLKPFLAAITLVIIQASSACAQDYLGFIKTSGTPNSHVEVHVASSSDGYKSRVLEIPTIFSNQTDGVWQLLSNGDLAFIKTSNTPNNHIEIHIASAASNYQHKTLETPTVFASETDGVWQLLTNRDLAFIRTSNTPNNHIEIHIASAASNYQHKTLETATTFLNESDGVWAMMAIPLSRSSSDGNDQQAPGTGKELNVDNNWTWIEDYFIPFGRDMSVQCEPNRACEIATGMAMFGDVGQNNRGSFKGNKEFKIGPAGAVYARMADGNGPGRLRYYAGKIGTKTWDLP